MSTARRRPTGASAPRKPQVAGRPRTTAVGAPGTEAEEATEGRVAVGERTDALAGAAHSRQATSVPFSEPAGTSGGPDSSRTRTVDRPGARPAGEETTPADTTVPGDDTPEQATGELPSAPAVRSGDVRERSESSEASEPSESSGSGSATRGAGFAARLRRIPMPQAPSTRRGTAALLAVTILLVAAAGFFAVSWGRLQFSGATSNTALSDVGATATVSEQVDEAVTKVYSFDYARLDQAESDARAVITGPFTGQFDQIFGNVRQLAPKQQAVVTATVPKSAVASINGNGATVYVFVNQVVRRVDDGGKPQQGTAAARLRVDAQFVDGRWKISGMTPA